MNKNDTLNERLDAIESQQGGDERGHAHAGTGLRGRGAMTAAKRSAIRRNGQVAADLSLELQADTSGCPKIDLGKKSDEVKKGEAKNARNKLQV